MRRRSERKKSTDVSSPAPASRRTNRRRKSQSVSEDDKALEVNSDFKNDAPLDENVEDSSGERERESSAERSESKRRRSSRMRTPVKELRNSPSKRRTRREITPEKKINTIIEEENGSVDSEHDSSVHAVGKQHTKKEEIENSKSQKKTENKTTGSSQKENKNDIEESKKIALNENHKNISAIKEKLDIKDNITTVDNKMEKDNQPRSLVKNDKNEILDKEDQDEVKLFTRDNSPGSRSNSSERKEQQKFAKTRGNVDDNNDDEPEEGEVIEKANKSDEEIVARTEVRERFLKRHTAEGSIAAKDEHRDHHKSEEVNNTQDGKTNESSNTTAAADTGRHIAIPNTTTRKRRWITKKGTESKEQILAISTDSLKTLIADVHPVPLSDVQLESSSEVEELPSEREEGEQSPSPEPERRRDSTEKQEKPPKILTKSLKDSRHVKQGIPGVGAVHASIQRSPSPARNQASNVLYITNLVRPFTVLQLKGLLARTGKIIENGFWIDRIKSKCYVEYETDDQAIETRHALHGVRWPASNPKCLNVDFGIKKDMLNAIESTKEETPKFGQETNKDNLLVGSGWSRERHEDEKKGSRPVREWDVGKKENLDREKVNRDVDRRRERSRDRSLDRNQDRSRDRNMSRSRENERVDRERDRRQRRERDVRSNSLSPVRKHKKKEDPPLRLLDDLFRKTKATPCIYWLPLTPEQIAEKEALRQKRLEEQKQRLKQRELEREMEREKERFRQGVRDLDRDRGHRRSKRSSDRRRSRSRDRRRY